MTSTAPIPGHGPGPSLDPDRHRRDRNHRSAVAHDELRSSRRHPSREDALRAVRTLIEWIGDDPDREGVLETPDRVLRAYGEFFAGYRQDPRDVLAKSFGELDGYDSAVIVRDIAFHSHCEHHMVPFTGKAHIAYLPDQRVVGLSKLARLVEVYARRLQVQERLTAQIATALQDIVRPRGVAVLVEAEHHCMTMRGVRKPGALTQTSMVTGAYRDEAARDRILRTLGLG